MVLRPICPSETLTGVGQPMSLLALQPITTCCYLKTRGGGSRPAPIYSMFSFPPSLEIFQHEIKPHRQLRSASSFQQEEEGAVDGVQQLFWLASSCKIFCSADLNESREDHTGEGRGEERAQKAGAILNLGWDSLPTVLSLPGAHDGSLFQSHFTW